MGKANSQANLEDSQVCMNRGGGKLVSYSGGTIQLLLELWATPFGGSFLTFTSLKWLDRVRPWAVTVCLALPPPPTASMWQWVSGLLETAGRLIEVEDVTDLTGRQSAG